MRAGKEPVLVNGRELTLTNLDKVLYPAAGYTKGAVVDYYARVAPVLVPHLAGRPLTLKRYPDGVDAAFFFQKNCPATRPAWLRVAPTEPRTCVVDDTAGLVFVANLASLELHPGLARIDDPKTPTVVVFDLDPGPPAGLSDCARLALDLHGLFRELGLVSVAKTSGGKGMQVYLPLNCPATFAQTKTFARAVAETLARAAPDHVVTRQAKPERVGRVLIDWSQNDPHKTTISVYSLRAAPTPTVSTPLAWDELRSAVRTATADRLVFDPAQALRRVAEKGDLFAAVNDTPQTLPRV
jgi:bifunctional non-homologous end joining protein LigD